MAPSVVALVPARAGSKRIPGKNIRPLAGHPLVAYAIAGAHASEVFSRVIVSTDCARTAQIARHYGAELPAGLRPAALAADDSPDIDWIRHTLAALDPQPDCFAILRPTSPFRSAQTIQRAWQSFLDQRQIDSLRAVELVSQHPGKMWVIQQGRLLPLMPFERDGTPWHSSQTASLPQVHAQNASLEIAWTRVALLGGTIAGTAIAPFLTRDYEGFDLNTPLDWEVAEALLRRGEVRLPSIEVASLDAST